MTRPDSDLMKTNRRLVLCWIVVLGAILFACLVTYRPLAAQPDGSGLLGAWDVFMAYGPWLYFTDHRIHDGEFPLWDPLTMCGQPFAANPQNLLFYPPNLIRSALTFNPTPLRTHVGFAILILIHVFIGALGVAALARKHGIHWIGACCAAIVFATSSQYVERLIRHPIFIPTIAWLPWLLLASTAIHAAQDKRARYRAAIATGMIFGLIALAGFPQLIIYSAIALFIFYVLQHMTAPANSESLRPSRLVRMVVPFVLILGIGGGLATASLLPAQEYAELSARQKGRELSVEDYVKNDYTPARITRSFLIYPGLENSSLKIAGTAALLLALAAAWHPKRRIALIYGVILYAFVDCAIGPPMPVATITAFLTPFRVVYPDYACFIACLPLAMLAGMGSDALLSASTRFAARIPVLVIGVAAYGVAFANLDELALQPSTTAIVVPGLLCCVLAAASVQRLKKTACAASVVLVLAEAVVWTPAFIPHLIDKWGSPPFEIDSLKDSQPFWSDNRRGATYTPNTNLYDMHAVINGYNPLFIEETYKAVCPPGMEDRYTWWLQLEVVQSNPRGNLFLKRPFWLARQAVIAPLPDKQQPFPPTTTVFLSNSLGTVIPEIPREQTRQQSISANQTITVAMSHEQLSALMTPPETNQFGKRATQYRIEGMRHPGKHSALRVSLDSEQTTTILGSLIERETNRKHFLLTTTVEANNNSSGVAEILLPDVQTFDLELILLMDPSGPTGELTRMEYVTDESDENSLISIASRSANAVHVNVSPLSEPRILVFNESFYPGWTATVDQSPAEIIRANDAFMAITLDSGSHDVVFEFKPKRVRIGTIVSVTVFALSILGFLLLALKRRNSL